MDQPFVTGSVTTASGQVPRISDSLTWSDHWGTVKARVGMNRMHYQIDPGLYAMGNPNAQAPLFASANYKLSFDSLRAALQGRNAWILVLDTKGINVWCAAGKGTFGTAELVNRIQSSGIEEILSHRKIILPQLAGPGVAAHAVKKHTGFTVYYGPVKAEDIPAYLDNGLNATPAMRRKTFTMPERAVLIPVELVQTFKTTLAVMAVILFLSGFGGPGTYWQDVLTGGLFSCIAFLSAIIAGALVTPLLLPFIPGRPFALKGLLTGIVAAVIITFLRNPDPGRWSDRLETAAWFLIIPSLSAYLAMNFTGASTYTSLSGVKKEMRWALPLEIVAGTAGAILWLGSLFTF